MAESQSDALVVFGVTGDLAHKMIFPALYAMVKRGTLKVPVIGVAFPKWSLERLQRRATDSIKRAGGIDDKRALATPFVSAEIRERRLYGQQYIHGDQSGAGEGTAACALSGNPACAF